MKLSPHSKTKEMASTDESNYDDIFMSLASQHGGIEPLLKTFFSFLHRKTDFYVVTDGDQHAKMGFPAGIAEKILLKVFRSFPYKPLGQQGGGPRIGSPRSSSSSSVAASSTTSASPPPTTPSSHQANIPPSSNRDTPVEKAKGEKAGGASPVSVTSNAAGGEAVIGEAPSSTTASGHKKDEKKQQPKEKTQPSIKYTSEGKQIPIGNGGITDKYYWTQSLSDVTVHVDVPSGTKSRDVSCEITPSKLMLAIKGSVLLEGSWSGGHGIKAQDSLWTLEGGGGGGKITTTLILTLEKTRPTWWGSVLEGDEEIDTTKVDSTMKVEEYDEATQGQIRKIMFDQKQKAMGLPISDELKMQEMLEKAKGMPGSSFL